MKPLPQLTKTPTQHPDCCCSLSTPLIATIAASLPSLKASVVSIGSGTGLLEALVLREVPNISLTAIEVSKAVNLYLPDGLVDVVTGTWDVSAKAIDAQCWLLVYPRSPKLLKDYFDLSGDAVVETIIWIGPRADAEDFDIVVDETAWSKEVHEDSGVGAYELLVKWVRLSRRQCFE